MAYCNPGIACICAGIVNPQRIQDDSNNNFMGGTNKMRKRFKHAMTIRMTDTVMDMVNEQSEALGLSKNQVIQIILKKVAEDYGRQKERTM